MNSAGLAAFLAPRSIAVIGGSNDPSRFGGRAVAYLKQAFPGELVLVNSHRDSVQGLPAVASLDGRRDPIDLAIIAVPADLVRDAAAQCIDHGAKAILVFSAGFSEAGEAGTARQAALTDLCHSNGVRLCGPNCIGLVNLNAGVLATFLKMQDRPLRGGNIGIVSQSGAVGAELFHQAQRWGLGVSYLLTSGNEADVTTLDWAMALVEGEEVDVVCLFAEGLRNGRDIDQLGRRAAERGKDVLVMKIGGSKAGATAAFSHTASLAVEDRVVDAALGRAGMHRVHSFRELLETAAILVSRREVPGRRLAVVTASGGMGVMVADAAERCGLDVAAPSAGDQATIRRLLPAFAVANNPIDLSAQVALDNERMPDIWSMLLQSTAFDAVVMAGVLRGLGPDFRRMMRAAAGASERLLVAWAPENDIAAELTAEGIPTVTDVAALANGLLIKAERKRRHEQTLLSPPPVGGTGEPAASVEALGGRAARALLEGAGIPFCQEVAVASAAEAIDVAARLGWPVVMKASADWLTHKTEHEAVMLGIATVADATRAFERLEAVIAGGDASGSVVVQEMVRGRWEIVCGMRLDPVFGPAVTVGLGGVLVEILGEQVLELAPLDTGLAIGMIGRLCGGRLVAGARGLPPARIADVAAVLCAISEIAVGNPDVMEVDINPLIVSSARVVAVDVLVGVARR